MRAALEWHAPKPGLYLYTRQLALDPNGMGVGLFRRASCEQKSTGCAVARASRGQPSLKDRATREDCYAAPSTGVIWLKM